MKVDPVPSSSVQTIAHFLGMRRSSWAFDENRLESYFHENAIWHYPYDERHDLGGVHIGLDAVADLFISLFTDVFNPFCFRWDVNELSEDESCVTAKTRCCGLTIEGEYYDADHVIAFEVEDGKISKAVETIVRSNAAPSPVTRSEQVIVEH